jgi:hypothetical protein
MAVVGKELDQSLRGRNARGIEVFPHAQAMRIPPRGGLLADRRQRRGAPIEVLLLLQVRQHENPMVRDRDLSLAKADPRVHVLRLGHELVADQLHAPFQRRDVPLVGKRRTRERLVEELSAELAP